MFSPDFIYLHKTNFKSLGPGCVEHSYPLVKKKKKKKNTFFFHKNTWNTARDFETN